MLKALKIEARSLITAELSVPVRSSPYRLRNRTYTCLLSAAFDKMITQQIQKTREA